MLKNLAKDTAIYGLTDFVFKFINFAIFPIISYVLSVEEFGLFALLSTLSLLVSVIFNCGLNHALQRFYFDQNLDKDQKNIVVSSVFGSLSVFAIVMISLFLLLAFSFKEYLLSHNQMSFSLIAIALLTCFPQQIFNYSINTLRLNFQPWSFTILTSLQNAINLVLSILLLFYFKCGVLGLVASLALSYALAAPLALWKIRKHLVWKFQWPVVKTLILFGFPFIFTDIASWIFGSMDRWMLGELSNNTQVGLYSIAFKISSIIIFMMGAFSMSFGPYAMKAYEEDPQHRILYSKCLVLWYYALVLVSLGLGFFGGDILRILTPQDYWPAATLIPMITGGFALYGTVYITQITISLTKKTSYISIISWVAAFINLVLNSLWIPDWGAHGAALASLVSYFVIACSYVLVSQKLFPIPLEIPKLIVITFILLSGITFACYLNSFELSLNILMIKMASFCMYLVLGHYSNIVTYQNLISLVGKRTATTVG